MEVVKPLYQVLMPIAEWNDDRHLKEQDNELIQLDVQDKAGKVVTAIILWLGEDGEDNMA